MPDGGAENARFAHVQVCPRHNGFHFLLGAVLGFDGLFAAQDGLGGIEHTHVVVQLLFDGRPIGQIFGKCVVGFKMGDADGLLWSVAAGLEPKIFKPPTVRCSERHRLIRSTNPVAMHGAVQIHAGDSFAMRLEDSLNGGLFVNAGGTLIMDYEIKALGVVWVAIDSERWLSALVVGVNLSHLCVETLFDALFEDILLRGVIVTAASGDEENSERLGLLGVRRAREQAEGQDDGW